MARGILFAVALAATLAAACGEAPESQQPEQAWIGTSQSIAIHSFGYFQGSSGYQRDRSQLTAEQLALLSQFEVREPLPSCGMDMMGYQITIVDAAGVEHRYHANEWDQACDSTDPLISMASLQPLLNTFACLSASDTRPGATHDVTPVVHPGDGCLHGVFIDGQGTRVRLDLAVAAAGPVTLETLTTADFASQVTLLDTDGTTVLGVGTEPAPQPGCSALSYAFAAAGTYYVEATSTNAMCGDILLRVR